MSERPCFSVESQHFIMGTFLLKNVITIFFYQAININLPVYTTNQVVVLSIKGPQNLKIGSLQFSGAQTDVFGTKKWKKLLETTNVW